MIRFGDIRSRYPNLCSAMSSYIRLVVTRDSAWPIEVVDHIHWDPEGQDWGWLSYSPGKACPFDTEIKIMEEHGFAAEITCWGEVAYDVVSNTNQDLPDLESAMIADAVACTICAEDMENAVILPCTHMFHKECILIWLYMKGECSVCRQSPTKIVRDLEELKLRGNNATNEARYLDAVQQYEACLSRLSRLVDIPKLRVVLHLNLAHVYLKIRAWEKATRNAKAVLEMEDVSDQQRGKALYRLALAEKGVGSWDAAYNALKEADQLVPDDISIQRAISDFHGKGC